MQATLAWFVLLASIYNVAATNSTEADEVIKPAETFHISETGFRLVIAVILFVLNLVQLVAQKRNKIKQTLNFVMNRIALVNSVFLFLFLLFDELSLIFTPSPAPVLLGAWSVVRTIVTANDIAMLMFMVFNLTSVMTFANESSQEKAAEGIAKMKKILVSLWSFLIVFNMAMVALQITMNREWYRSANQASWFCLISYTFVSTWHVSLALSRKTAAMAKKTGSKKSSNNKSYFMKLGIATASASVILLALVYYVYKGFSDFEARYYLPCRCKVWSLQSQDYVHILAMVSFTWYCWLPLNPPKKKLNSSRTGSKSSKVDKKRAIKKNKSASTTSNQNATKTPKSPSSKRPLFAAKKKRDPIDVTAVLGDLCVADLQGMAFQDQHFFDTAMRSQLLDEFTPLENPTSDPTLKCAYSKVAGHTARTHKIEIGLDVRAADAYAATMRCLSTEEDSVLKLDKACLGFDSKWLDDSHVVIRAAYCHEPTSEKELYVALLGTRHNSTMSFELHSVPAADMSNMCTSGSPIVFSECNAFVCFVPSMDQDKCDMIYTECVEPGPGIEMNEDHVARSRCKALRAMVTHVITVAKAHAAEHGTPIHQPLENSDHGGKESQLSSLLSQSNKTSGKGTVQVKVV